MELIEAILSRYSVRAYKPAPVPKEILQELLKICIRAPSWNNTQPWEFAIVGGKVMDELKQALSQKVAAETPPDSDIPAPTFTGRYLERGRENARELFGVLGIVREDREKRRQWRLAGSRLYDAPNAIILYIDKSLTTWSIMDAGIVMQTIMLAAQNYGLGTCPQYQAVMYPEELRRILNIPESKLIVCGLAIGYPDTNAPPNRFRSARDPLEAFVTWYGIDGDNL